MTNARNGGARDARRLDAQLLSDLWIFRAAASHGSITQAAARLNVTQGAVSQRVLRLESRLGTELFTRRKGKIELTEAGAVVLEAMNAASAGLNDALARIGRRHRSGLVVSCSPSLATEWLMPKLQDFYRTCPGVELLVRAEMAAPSVTWMEEQRIDVLIDYLHDEVPGLYQLASLRELIFPVCSRTYRARLDASPEGERAVVLMHDDDAWQGGEPPGAEWGEWLDAVGERRGFSIQGERHFNLAYLAYQAAVYGQGMAIGRSVSVHHLLQAGDLVAVTGLEPVPSAHYRVLSLTPAPEGSPAARFAAWVADAMVDTQEKTLALLRPGRGRRRR